MRSCRERRQTVTRCGHNVLAPERPAQLSPNVASPPPLPRDTPAFLVVNSHSFTVTESDANSRKEEFHHATPSI